MELIRLGQPNERRRVTFHEFNYGSSRWEESSSAGYLLQFVASGGEDNEPYAIVECDDGQIHTPPACRCRFIADVKE